MRVLFLSILLVGCASNVKTGRIPANDPTYELTQFLSQSPAEERPKYCQGNPPGSDDAWCSWVCIDGRWSKVCR